MNEGLKQWAFYLSIQLDLKRNFYGEEFELKEIWISRRVSISFNLAETVTDFSSFPLFFSNFHFFLFLFFYFARVNKQNWKIKMMRKRHEREKRERSGGGSLILNTYFVFFFFFLFRTKKGTKFKLFAFFLFLPFVFAWNLLLLNDDYFSLIKSH